MFKESTLSCLFDIGGLAAGFAIALQLGVFQLSPWALALYPAVLSVKGFSTGLLAGRLSTELHLGTVYPKFFGNTKNFYRLISAIVVLTLVASATISIISILFGSLFWGITVADFPAILTVMVTTLSFGLLTTLISIKVMFASFKRSLDPELIVFPAISTMADIIITLLYVGVLNLYFYLPFGKWAIALLGLINVGLVLIILPRTLREKDFVNILKDSLPALLLMAVVVNFTGTILKDIKALAAGNKVIYTVYPAIVDLIGDVGLIVGSAATTKLALGVLSPSFSSIKNHAKNIFSAWAASLILFFVIGFAALGLNGISSIQEISSILSILIFSNIIAFVAITFLTFAISIVTFKRGLNPDNFVIPTISSIADCITTIALFVALLIFL
jgi:mgtE-like transporter